jgi:hypothetical protein
MTAHQPRRIRPHATPKPPKPQKPPKPAPLAVDKYAALEFNYALIEDDYQRGLMQQAASDIRARLRRSIADMIEIGQQLKEIQELLDHKRFYEWAQIEFGLSRGSIFEFIQIYMRFAENRSIIERFFTPTIVRRLAAVSVPDAAVEQVIEAARTNGKRLRVQDAMAIVRPYMPVKQPRPKQLAGPVVPEPEPDEPDAIEAEYTVVTEPGSPLGTFAEWLAAMPAELSLRDHLAILELAKGSATRMRNVRPSLYNAVSNVMMQWSQLIHAVEQELRK